MFGKTEEVDEAVTDENVTTKTNGHDKTREEQPQDDKDFKPVFLKGLFSVATTSTKPPSTLKADIRQVLYRMQVQYRETRTGFDCIHMPSIDLSSISDDHSRQRHQKQGSSGSTEISNPSRRGIVKRASKLSFKMLNRENNKEGSVHEKEKELPNRPSGGTTLTATPSNGSSSFFNVSSNAHTVLADSQRSETDTATAVPTGEELATSLVSPSTAKTLPPIPRDYAATPASTHGASMQGLPAGETDEDLFELIGANKLAVRFEINVVKVPWLPLHGIQFRRASGDGWQYHMLARRVLTELKL
jgi:hypothetical protein